MDQFWNWARVHSVDSDGNVVTGEKIWAKFKKEFWFELGKSMWRKHSSIFQYHVKYIYNDIVKLFGVYILQNAKRVCEMNDIFRFLPTL